MARTTAQVLGFDPKQLDDDALLAALTPTAPSIPFEFFSTHSDAMAFEPSCECPTCKVASDYQAAYAKYEADKARLAPDALPAMVAKRVARIEKEKVKSAYQMACDALTERGINIIPDSECVEKDGYVIWSGWTPQMRVWLAEPKAITRYYETIARQAAMYGHRNNDRAAEERKQENVWAHPTKKVRVQGWFSVQRTYQYTIDSTGRQYRTEYRSGEVYDNDHITTQTSAYPSSAQRSIRPPKEQRKAHMRQLMERVYYRSNPLMDRQEYSRRVKELDLLFTVTDESTKRYWRSHRLIRDSTFSTGTAKEIMAIFARVGKAIANPSEDNVESMIASLQNMRDAYWPDKAEAMCEAWNARVTEPSLMILSGDCGHYHTSDDGHTVLGGTVCESCFHDYYVFAIDVNNWILRSQASQHEYDEDDLDEDGDPRESGWYSYRRGNGPQLVKNYSDNVLNFYPKDTTITPSVYGDVLMGVELEVAPKPGVDRGEPVKHTHKNLCKNYAIMKNDGSLPSGGFEIVTAPRGLKEHIQRFGDWTPHADMRAWDTGQCGLHVHLSSQSFTAATLGKFLEFINKVENSSIVQAVAGRTPETDRGAQQYCQREGKMVKGNPKKTLAGKDTHRYRMVNCCNLSRNEAKRLGLSTDNCNGKSIDTVELRIFRASLKKGRLLAQVEFAHAAVMFCRQASMRELERDHFILWLRKAAGIYPNLAKWFGVRANTATVNDAPQVCADAEV